MSCVPCMIGLGGLVLSAAASAQAPGPIQTEPVEPPRALRVCANPDNLPYSNREQEGFENRIAELIGAELGLPVSYLWHAQRRGFLRRTLNAGRCDLVVGAPAGLERLVTTKPYYRSSYVFVTRKDRKLGIRSFDDPALKGLKIGLHVASDDGNNPPPAYSLARRGLAGNIVGYRLWDVDGVENPQGRVIGAVASGEIDLAIVWGPFAGYFAKEQPVALEIVPVPTDIAALPSEFDMALGVRKGEDAFKARLETILDKRGADIRAILASYGIPLVDKPTLASAVREGTRPMSGEKEEE